MIALLFVAFLAGFVDAIVGGGGLIQLPALFVFLPQELAGIIPAVMGTNKF
ncbi:MAG: sulfite exporter TauE/SafE family protein, partial [Verrucomicrobiota bacterium]